MPTKITSNQLTECEVSVASAPGKVLIVGGYLVLDREFKGLVVGTDARFYAAVKTVDKQEAPADTDPLPGVVLITVTSVQFNQTRWSYALSYGAGGSKELALSQVHSANGGKNRFVETVIQCTLLLVQHANPAAISELFAGAAKHVLIALAADNDFYSQAQELRARGLPPTSKGLSMLPKFCHTNTTLRDVHKTGLGSSAAMVTSLVAALLQHFGLVGKGNPAFDKQLIHNLAQYCHCLAQGKIGSGFDISAAVFGSHTYRRFSPKFIEGVMAANTNGEALFRAIYPQSLDDMPMWDSQFVSVSVPPRFILRLADVDTGSHTPSMVSKVLSWKKANLTEAAVLWKSIAAANDRVVSLWHSLSELAEQNSQAYNSAIDAFAAIPSTEWPSLGGSTKSGNKSGISSGSDSSRGKHLLVELRDACLEVRFLLRRLGALSSVPIEPPEQTRLLDACMSNVPGVVMAGVPGAGGYDAIYCIVLDQAAADTVERLWVSWKEMS
ncbi:phosphomevalonate kinase, partial [Spiromyces aspiralis]